MTGWLLDTNICIYVIRQKPLNMILRFQSLDVSEVGISSITLSELECGIAKSAKPAQNRVALTLFLAPLRIFPYDHRAAQQYGRIREELERSGTPIGPLDMLIAAHALALGSTLVTNNIREFERVPGLSLENWIDGPG